MTRHALLVVDVQNDFCHGGTLAVEKADEIIPSLNRLISECEHLIITQDWHPANHSSFASNHKNKAPFETVEMAYGMQTLWPDHCVQGTKGAEFHPDLEWQRSELVLRKGFRPGIDSYSSFFENDRETPTGLAGYLRERSIDSLSIAGLATDYCVAYSALDAIALGFQVRLQLEACRAIDLNGSLALMLDQMKQAGVELVGQPVTTSYMS